MESAFAKLDRAKTHYSALNESIEGWRAELVHEWSVSSSNQLTENSLTILEIHLQLSTDPPSDWGLIVGDILTNLRAALDHSIFGHATARLGITKTQERQLSFPILLDRDHWFGSPAVAATKTSPRTREAKGVRQSLVELLSPAVLDIVQQAQPFNISAPREHALAELNKLVNLDKHRVVQVVTFLHEKFELKHADLDVLRIDAPRIPHSAKTAVATLHVRHKSFDDRGRPDPTSADFHFTHTSYEALELPSDGQPEEVRHVMSVLIEQVEHVLHCLKSVDC